MTVGHNFQMSEEQENEFKSQLRKKFFQDFSDEVSSSYDTRDVTRLRNIDEYVLSFLKHNRWSIDKAVTMIDKCFKWRKELNVNDLNEEYFVKELFNAGAIYSHNHDKDNHRILLFHIAKHKKDASKLPLLKQFVAFWLDRLFWENMNEPIIVMFDMTNAGLANLDLEFIKYIINCFEEYYPEFLAYLVNFEMPWILNAAWRIIKGWLSEDARAHVKFANKRNIDEYISSDQLLVHMGGKDTFQYEYTPGQYTEQFTDADSVDNFNNTNTSGGEDNHTPEEITPSRQVHFHTVPDSTDAPPLTNRSDLNEITNNNGSTETIPQPQIHRETQNNIQLSKPNRKTDSVRRRKPSSVTSSDSDRTAKSLIQIQPSLHEIYFGQVNGKLDEKTTLNITNISPKIVSYKLRTTSVHGFKVHPSSGFLKVNETVEITINLKNGHVPTNDRFLILAALVTGDLERMDANSFWKICAKSHQTEHRLTCVVNRNVGNELPNMSNTQHLSPQQITRLLGSVNTMQSQMRTLIILNIINVILFVMIFLFLVFGGSNPLKIIPFINNPTET